MENQKLVLQLNEGNTEKPNIIHVLNGDLPEPIDLKPNVIDGNIFSVSKYIQGKNLSDVKIGIDAKTDDDEPVSLVSLPSIVGLLDTFILIHVDGLEKKYGKIFDSTQSEKDDFIEDLQNRFRVFLTED